MQDPRNIALTNSNIQTLWLVFPIDSQEIYGDTGQHDSQTSTADDRLRVEGEDQQEGPDQQVEHRPYQVHLVEEEEANHIWSKTERKCATHLGACWFLKVGHWL